ncbi:hypothetical protein [Nibrella viscosa]|uniref:hypothetical protein n=1 Tax=Nibrella viscosa TaxID=1084524 RepID=UPI0031E56083
MNDWNDVLIISYTKFTNQINRFSQSYQWHVKTWLLSLLILIFLTAPFFNFHYIFDRNLNWETIEFQSRNFLQRPIAFGNSHIEKMVFRLAVPLLAKLFALNRYGIYLGQLICCGFFLWLMIGVTYKLVNSRVNTILFVIASLPCYFVFTGPYDVFGRPDAYPLLCLLIALYFKNPLIILIATFAAAWCDERAIINATWLYLFWSVYGNKTNSNTPFLFTPLNRYSAGVLFGGVFYLIGRFTLAYFFNFPTLTSNIGSDALQANLKYGALSIFSTFGALWLLAVATTLLLLYRHQYQVLLLYTICLFFSVLTSILVYDIDRSMAYSFPLLFFCLLILKEATQESSLQLLLCLIMLINLIKPVTVWDSHFHYIPNLLLRCVEQWGHA